MKLDKKEFLISSAKSIFGTIPFAGTAFNELFFEYNGNIKQKRLNKFIEILSEYFSQNEEINIDNIKTEDFNDLFESVLRRVVRTKSEKKLIRFKDILIKELKKPSEETEIINLYLELISSLTEEEIIILKHHKNFNAEYEDKVDKVNSLRDQINRNIELRKSETIIIGQSKYEIKINQLEKERKELNKYLEPLKKYRTAEFYGLNNMKFQLFKQMLSAKGLLIDNGMNRIGTSPFQLMNISEFGEEFINFIYK